VCRAATHQTGKDGGIFLLIIHGQQDASYVGSNKQNVQSRDAHSYTGRSFCIEDTAYPYRLDLNGDGIISPVEAATAGSIIFKGIDRSLFQANSTGAFNLAVAETVEIDADHDLVISEKEHLKWVAARIHLKMGARESEHSEL
jgi:hypothetical protein